MRRSNREIQAAGSQVLPLGVSAVAAQATGRDLVPHHEASCSDPEIIESAQSDRVLSSIKVLCKLVKDNTLFAMSIWNIT